VLGRSCKRLPLARTLLGVLISDAMIFRTGADGAARRIWKF
jgi:hypothetical protein